PVISRATPRQLFTGIHKISPPLSGLRTPPRVFTYCETTLLSSRSRCGTTSTAVSFTPERERRRAPTHLLFRSGLSVPEPSSPLPSPVGSRDGLQALSRRQLAKHVDVA
ncbi:unnamed protein product, partial [Ectocarpus sp. 8 AP-2014]